MDFLVGALGLPFLALGDMVNTCGGWHDVGFTILTSVESVAI